MKIRDISMAVLFAAAMLALPAIASAAGHIQPSGVTEGEASQLIVWYDESGPLESPRGSSFLQVTNGSTDTAVNIHVQIFADNVSDSSDLCREHDFNDTLTANDTHLYIIGDIEDNLTGADIAVDVDETRGFIIVTAVDKITLPRQAIAHNHLFGTIGLVGDIEVIRDDLALPEEEIGQRMNAMGRVAVDFATGEPLADGVLLDGIGNGLTLLQPSLFYFNYSLTGFVPPSDFAEINSIAFSDNYSDPNGEYRAEPSTAVWDAIIYDDIENGTSCQQHINNCFVSMGLNEQAVAVVDAPSDPITLCPSNDENTGWVEMAVSGVSGLDNALGLTGYIVFDESDFSVAGASWMVAD